MSQINNLLELDASALVHLLRKKMSNAEVSRESEIDKSTISRIYRAERTGCSEDNYRALARLAVKHKLIRGR